MKLEWHNGQIVIKINKSIPSNERGLFLLELEEKIKYNIDRGITIWCEPVGDKSALRKLRGVKIKSWKVKKVHMLTLKKALLF